MQDTSSSSATCANATDAASCYGLARSPSFCLWHGNSCQTDACRPRKAKAQCEEGPGGCQWDEVDNRCLATAGFPPCFMQCAVGSDAYAWNGSRSRTYDACATWCDTCQTMFVGAGGTEEASFHGCALIGDTRLSGTTMEWVCNHPQTCQSLTGLSDGSCQLLEKLCPPERCSPRENECPPGKRCEHGICVKRASDCRDEGASCPQGYYCGGDGDCTLSATPCAHYADCTTPPNFACIDGICVNICEPAGPMSTECPLPYKCENGTCQKSD